MTYIYHKILKLIMMVHKTVVIIHYGDLYNHESERLVGITLGQNDD